jgi:hypothetical protein
MMPTASDERKGRHCAIRVFVEHSSEPRPAVHLPLARNDPQVLSPEQGKLFVDALLILR